MRRWHSFSVCRRLVPLNHRPVSYSLVHSSTGPGPAPTASPAHIDSKAGTSAPTHHVLSTSPTCASPFTPVAARHPTRLQHAHTLTVLHTARELISRILPPQSLELSFWNDIL